MGSDASQTGEQTAYKSYLLRLWRVDQDVDGDSDNAETPLWRASLESAHTGARISFVNLESLFNYLRHEAGLHADQVDPDPHPD